MNFEPASWRLIEDQPALGAWNMAVDEALLESTARGDCPPTLRLYAWEPACLSLGYAQRIGDVDEERLAAKAWTLVRRPTGGRAILHTDELTYSVTGPEDEARLAGDIITSYKRLSAALLAALQRLSVGALAQPEGIRRVTRPNEPVCFEVPSKYELTMDNKKLVGSAQARRLSGVLQHGTLPLSGDLTRITQVLVFENEAARGEAGKRLLERATTVESALGQPVGWDDAAAAMRAGFEEVLNIRFEAGALSQAEQARAETLMREKYGHDSWTRAK
jgi:lipoate-protein ligase A